MLNALVSSSKMTKEEYQELHASQTKELMMLQQKAIHAGIGVVALFEGWELAGIGARMSDLLATLDARAINVHTTEQKLLSLVESDLVRRGSSILQPEQVIFPPVGRYKQRIDPRIPVSTGVFPLMDEFWNALCPRGKMTLYNRGWYSAAAYRLFYLQQAIEHASKKEETRYLSVHLDNQTQAYKDAILDFERQLVQSDYTVIKFFFHLDQKEQEKRLKQQASRIETALHVNAQKLLQNKEYATFFSLYDELIIDTEARQPSWMTPLGDADAHPEWVFLDAFDERRCNVKIFDTMIQALRDALDVRQREADREVVRALTEKIKPNTADQGEASAQETEDQDEEPAATRCEEVQIEPRAVVESRIGTAPASSRYRREETLLLEHVSHDLKIRDEDYEVWLKEEQKRLNDLQLHCHLKRIPLMVAFEGWDAAGKGGTIKRVARALDAGRYHIFTSPAPTALEQMHPFLWRYWTRLPRAGNVALYDRTWYGRVLVERVEGLTPEKDWQRAYDEINCFEEQMVCWGAVLVKFWVNVSPETQLTRFKERESDEYRAWKIGPDDWRNRARYSDYMVAVDDMLRLTSTELCPWTILEADDKKYARVKALHVINEAIEAKLGLLAHRFE